MMTMMIAMKTMIRMVMITMVIMMEMLLLRIMIMMIIKMTVMTRTHDERKRKKEKNGLTLVPL